MKKLLPPVLFIIFVILMGIVCWGFGFSHLVEYPYNLIGLPFLLGGLLLAQASKKIFLRLKTNVDTFKDPDILVTTGIFRFTRNPMYLGFVVSLIGAAILYQGAVSSFILAVIFFVITDRWYIRYEERALLDKFGNEYEMYRTSTRRWV